MSEEKEIFIPLILPVNAVMGRRDLRRVFRHAVHQALGIPTCAAAIAPYKSNGEVYGHKVLDNSKAVEELIRVAPDHLKPVLEIGSLSLYEKSQALDQVLRKEFVMDKRGKIDGTLNPKRLAKQSSDPKASSEPTA